MREEGGGKLWGFICIGLAGPLCERHRKNAKC